MTEADGARNKTENSSAQSIVWPNIYWLHLGANLPKKRDKSVSNEVNMKNIANLQQKISQFPTFLTVGTLEPRKGHYQALQAFENLWKRGIQVNWVIVGKEGWKVKSLIKELSTHAELNNRLFWFEKTSDMVLSRLYQTVNACLVTSEAEGFGLPLIEAAQYNSPLLVRDIPVFREVAGDHAMYFSGNNPKDLERALEQWLACWRQNTVVPSTHLSYSTWKESAQNLVKIIVNHEKTIKN
jgi:glycosyltransferase involved in cell wall biosynthesis